MSGSRARIPSLSGQVLQEGKFRVAIGAPRGDIPAQGDRSMSTHTAVLKRDITPKGS
ncbi:MAG: 6-O-methylguanine DNA methyltransferase, partial [Mesorhizobium sp.]